MSVDSLVPGQQLIGDNLQSRSTAMPVFPFPAEGTGWEVAGKLLQGVDECLGRQK